MWNLIASLLALAIFSIIALMVNDYTVKTVRQVSIARAEQQSGILLARFAAAARDAAQAKGWGQGTNITVQTLVSEGYLPQGFPDMDAFGLPFRAVVGVVSGNAYPVAAWADGSPAHLFGFPVNETMIRAVAFQVAQNAAAAQQNNGSMIGVADGAAPPYTALRLPFATSSIPLNGVIPGFSANAPSSVIVYMQ